MAVGCTVCIANNAVVIRKGMGVAEIGSVIERRAMTGETVPSTTGSISMRAAAHQTTVVRYINVAVCAVVFMGLYDDI